MGVNVHSVNTTESLSSADATKTIDFHQGGWVDTYTVGALVEGIASRMASGGKAR